MTQMGACLYLTAFLGALSLVRISLCRLFIP